MKTDATRVCVCDKERVMCFCVLDFSTATTCVVQAMNGGLWAIVGRVVLLGNGQIRPMRSTHKVRAVVERVCKC